MMSIGKPRFASAPAAAVRCLSESFSRAASAVARSSAFDFGSAIGENGAMKKCEAAFAVEALDPGVPYESRWAPYVRIHGPGQGQFPKGSIRPRGYMAPDARHSLARANVATKWLQRQRREDALPVIPAFVCVTARCR